jgi:hypothetical protein
MSYINSALHIYSNGYNSTSQSYSTLLDHSIAQISTHPWSESGAQSQLVNPRRSWMNC